VENNEIFLLDLNFDKKPLLFSSIRERKNVHFIEGNVLNIEDLKTVVKDSNIVVHMAAIVGIRNVIQSARDTINTNFIGTSNLLRALENNSKLERFIYISTSEVFGINSYNVAETTFSSIGLVNEARWSYAISKLAGEHLTHGYFKELEFPTVIVRPFNVFGPKRIGDHVIIRFLKNALSNKKLIIHGDGSQIRSWCFIEDFCDGLMRCISKKEAIGEDFNIGNKKNTTTIYELAKLIVRMSNSKSTISFKYKDYGDIDVRVPNLAKSEKILGYNPKYEIEEAMQITLDWVKKYWKEINQYIGDSF
jgi:nucleoside-diphosphate-sugar epimerase